MLEKNDIEPQFDTLFKPRSVAIVGASTRSPSAGNRLLKILRESGFDGNIYVIHPKSKEIEGIKAYVSFADLPEVIDYAFVCVAAAGVPNLVRSAHQHVRFMQVMTSGFGEAKDGTALEEDLKFAVKQSDVRLLGPNCIGMHTSAGKISYIENAEFQDGGISVLSQSGGLSIDILRRGQQLGLKFHSVVSLGNSLDINSTDLLAHHLKNDSIKVIGIYIENISDGRAFFETLSSAKGRKPIVILKGGRTSAGQKAAASHTGSIADDARIWDALQRQTGINLVDTLGDFLNLLGLYQAYHPTGNSNNRNIVLFGNGGGASVLAADQFAWQGLELYSFNAETAEQLETLDVPAGSSLINPIDVPANAIRRDGGMVVSRIFDTIAKGDTFGALIMHLNLTVLAGYNSDEIVGNAIQALCKFRDDTDQSSQVVLVLRSDFSEQIFRSANRYRLEATKAGIPVFNELSDAACALGAFKKTAAFKRKRGINP
jgi:acyl-CoA synthetase (NDP forming)